MKYLRTLAGWILCAVALVFLSGCPVDNKPNYLPHSPETGSYWHWEAGAGTGLYLGLATGNTCTIQVKFIGGVEKQGKWVRIQEKMGDNDHPPYVDRTIKRCTDFEDKINPTSPQIFKISALFSKAYKCNETKTSPEEDKAYEFTSPYMLSYMIDATAINKTRLELHFKVANDDEVHITIMAKDEMTIQ